MDEGTIMICKGDSQRILAAAAAIACGAAVWLSVQSMPPVARGAAAATESAWSLSSPDAAMAASTATATPPDDAAARFATALDDAQRGAHGEPAADLPGLDDTPLRPDALIAQSAGGRYAALVVRAQPAAPQASTRR